jgi:hypothetical protein
MSVVRFETIKTDVTVVGGGLAGVCAAVAAARLGQTVAFINNRPVLGGNSSSEVRVWVCGATAHFKNRYARETGIMGEMFLENQYRNPDGNPYLWDLVVLETVKAEPNIQLFLNTDVHEVEADGDETNRLIRSVTGWMMGSERRIRFESPVYLDCTGDGLVGFLAGAKYRLGREAREEYKEEWAPEVADNITLGSTILFYTKDVGHPVKYVPPSFAKDITETSIPIKRVIKSGDSGCHYWWIEWGGELDTVHENERIRDELWAVIYGIWDYIKNSGKFDAETMTLEWVGSLPGKREYRRLIGDYVLNQNDILAQEQFEDRIAFGGWSIDLHPPQGMYATESGSKHWHADGIYHIPYRSLYSVNVSNLLFAGRNISATHVAFGSTRVMATCATIGEAAGTAAALCVQRSATPRQLYETHLEELQQVLLKQDASIIGVANGDANDLARSAVVQASSTLSQLSTISSGERYPLIHDVGIMLPVDPELRSLELFVDSAAGTELLVELWDTGRAENYIPKQLQARSAAFVPEGEAQWVAFDLQWTPGQARNAFIIIKENSHVKLHMADSPLSGALIFQRGATPNSAKELEDADPTQPVVEWSMKPLMRKMFCFRSTTMTTAYSPDKVIDGYKRPYGGPHQWTSEPLVQGREEWLQLDWKSTVSVQEIQLTWSSDVNEDLINLHHHETPFEVIPEIVRNYRLEALVDGVWSPVCIKRDNRKRTTVHRLEAAVLTKSIRLIIASTNGGRYAEVVEIRAYS